MPKNGPPNDSPSEDFKGFPKRSPRPHFEEEEKINRLRRAMYSRSIAPNIKPKARREFEQERPIVGEEWMHEEPKLDTAHVAPRGISLSRTLLRWILGIAIAFCVGAVGFFAYYFLIGGGSIPASPGNIDISVSGPLQITSGEPTELQIAVVNKNRTALELADLIITYPDGTRSPADLATNLKDQRISLGNIEPGGRRQGTVSAVFSGQEGNRGLIKVELEYRLTSSSAIFVASTNYEVTFATSPLSISLEANSETVSGQAIEFKVNVRSNSDVPLKDVLLTIGFPFGFTPDSSALDGVPGGGGKPTVTSSRALWSLGDLNPGVTKTVLLRGTVNGEQGDERVFRFTAGTRPTIKDQAITTILADYQHHLTVSRPFLGLSIVVNKTAQGGTAVVAPGETVNVSITYKNNLDSAITDAIVVARLAGVSFDGSKVRTNDGFYRSSDNVVLWDKTTTGGELANLPSGAEGTLDFSFQVPESSDLEGINNPDLSISVNAAGRRASQSGTPESLQATALQNIRLASDLQLLAQGLYYANPFGSAGPMPPKAGAETTYAIVLSLTNTTNKVQNGKVRFSLPPYARWIGIYSPANEKISFNQSDGTMTWDVGEVDAGVGVGGSSPRQAAIAIGVTPSTSQIGQQPILARSITFTGTDTATQTSVTRTAPDVTTNISGDPGFNATNATVVK